MRLSTSTNILFERRDGTHWEQTEAIRLCAQAGYRVMDFCFQDLNTYNSPLHTGEWEAYMNRISQIAEEQGVEFGQGHALAYNFCDPDLDQDYMLELTKRCIRGAEILKIRWLVMHPSTDFGAAAVYRESKEKNVEYFSRLSEYAQRHHVGLALENMWDYHIAPVRCYAVSAEELVELADSVGAVGICWDVEHASIMKQDQVKALGIVGHRLKATHISDQNGLDNIHILPWLGCSDWDQILYALKSVGYEGDFSFEVHRYLVNMPEELVPQALRFSYEIGNYLLQKSCKLQ